MEDERQLDGSRHLEIVGDDVDAALRLVISRDGNLEEAELSLEFDGDYTVIAFHSGAGTDLGEALELDLESACGQAAIRQREDGDLDLTLALTNLREQDE